MKLKTTDHLLWLADRQLLRLEEARGWRVVCRHGRLLVTQYRDARDHVLAPGDSLRIGSRGLVLVEGDGVACVELLV